MPMLRERREEMKAVAVLGGHMLALAEVRAACACYGRQYCVYFWITFLQYLSATVRAMQASWDGIRFELDAKLTSFARTHVCVTIFLAGFGCLTSVTASGLGIRIPDTAYFRKSEVW